MLPAFQPKDAEEERLTRAICHLVDVSWRAHPDYRTFGCLEVATRVNVSSSGHQGRAFIAASLLARYKGGRKAIADAPEVRLLGEERLSRAMQLGALMRLGATISGAVTGYLNDTPLLLNGNVLRLEPVPTSKVLMGEEVEKRLSQAARAMELDWEIGRS